MINFKSINYLDKYFKETKEGYRFQDLFSKRYIQYSKILNNETTPLLFGKTFCSNFFRKETGSGHLAIMYMIRGTFSAVMITTKEFLDEVSSKFEIV